MRLEFLGRLSGRGRRGGDVGLCLMAWNRLERGRYLSLPYLWTQTSHGVAVDLKSDMSVCEEEDAGDLALADMFG